MYVPEPDVNVCLVNAFIWVKEPPFINVKVETDRLDIVALEAVTGAVNVFDPTQTLFEAKPIRGGE